MIQATSLKTAKKTLLLAGLLVLPILAAAIPVSASALPTPPSGKEWAAGFSDEFNSTSLNTTNWSTCYHWYSVDYQGCTNAGNNEKQWYMPSQVSVGNGVARLSAEKRTVTGWNNGEQQYNYVSGMLTTGGEQWQQTAKKTMLYGYSEARIKVSAGQGLWTAFWMLSADYEWPP